MYFLTWIGVIVGGALCIPSLVASKSPEAAEQLKKLAPFQGYIGVGVLVLGIWGVISALGWFMYPLFAISLLACAVVAIGIGIILGYGLIQSYALKKASDDVKAKAEETLKKLQGIQVPLGIAGIICGIVSPIVYYVF